MKRILNYTILPTEQNMNIRDFLKEKGYSKALLIHFKANPSYVLKNQVPAYLNEKLKQNDHLMIIIEETNSSMNIIPVNLPLSIVYEDEDLLVLNKPAGMPIHPSLNNFNNSLANALAYYFEEQNISFVFRCVNRLDRDTSGLTIIAKHLLSSIILNTQMVNGLIHREYLAIVEGDLSDRGIIRAPICRTDTSIIERHVDFEQGECAITHFQKIFNQNGFSLVSLTLETGRTHQIRVHMKHINHPLIGDFLYHPNNRDMSRQALHAARVSFYHPITGKFLEFKVPLPEDFILP